MPSTGNPEKSGSQTKPSLAKTVKKPRAGKKKPGAASRPATSKVKKPRAGGKTNGQAAPAAEQTVIKHPGARCARPPSLS